MKRSGCSQELLPPSPRQSASVKASLPSKGVSNLYAMHSPPQSRSAPDSNDAAEETLRATSEEAATNSELRKVFLEFARFGTRSHTKHMDIYRFMKMCRECGLLLRQQDVSSIDLIFYKVRRRTRLSMHACGTCMCSAITPQRYACVGLSLGSPQLQPPPSRAQPGS